MDHSFGFVGRFEFAGRAPSYLSFWPRPLSDKGWLVSTRLSESMTMSSMSLGYLVGRCFG
jgi:hypothetical protein